MPEFDIAYVAHLARLELSDAEKAKLSAQVAFSCPVGHSERT
jgi:hypothetical protein